MSGNKPVNYWSTYEGCLERLRNGEMGDDLPCSMADLGVDYDAACDAVFNKKHDDAIRLLEEAWAASTETSELRM